MSSKDVNKAATQRGALKKSALSLLGVFGPKDAMQALVRMPSGRVKTVKPGTRLSGGRVAAIDADGLIVQKNGQAQRMILQQ
ncbi:hypothetical protein [Ruegeria hyattellae]|jgi:type IV pilus biogenesis protein PilP|uniref:hypothetical protein n=1 Tax=Ruegeria hyattellae TaxID=3233337 RepID=UPI00355BDB56